jgi:hypothetical protein
MRIALSTNKGGTATDRQCHYRSNRSVPYAATVDGRKWERLRHATGDSQDRRVADHDGGVAASTSVKRILKLRSKNLVDENLELRFPRGAQIYLRRLPEPFPQFSAESNGDFVVVSIISRSSSAWSPLWHPLVTRIRCPATIGCAESNL